MLIGISQLAATVLATSCTRSADQAAAPVGNSDLELLAGIAYDILPYSELPPAAYVRAAQQILSLNDTGVTTGLRTLRASIHNSAWQEVPEARRVELLTSLQATPFFNVLRANTVQVLLRDPLTYPIVGYGGPSIQYGGYLNRGFNDIHWLPAAAPGKQTQS
jgi:hypothetical protein